MAFGSKKHLILVLVYRRERGLAIANFLRSLNLEVMIASTVYDGLKICSQEMPYLILSESKLSDGNSGMLYDRLKAHPILKQMPIIVFEQKNSESRVDEREYAAVLKAPTAQQLKETVVGILQGYDDVSPYFISVHELPDELSMPLQLSVPAKVMGIATGHLVVESALEIDATASLSCEPKDTKFTKVVLSHAHSLQDKSAWYNFFPLHRIQGSGRKWMDTLPDLGLCQGGKSIIFVDTEPLNFLGFKKAFAGYGVNFVHAANLKDAGELFANMPEEFSALFITGQSLLNPDNRIAQGAARPKLPPMIVQKTMIARPSSQALRFIQQPSGLNAISDTLRSSLISLAEVKRSLERVGFTGVLTTLDSKAHLFGLDETGGTLQSNYPIALESKIEINSSFLQELWGGKKTVAVDSVSNVNGSHWLVHFRAIPKGTSKSIYYSKLRSLLPSIP